MGVTDRNRNDRDVHGRGRGQCGHDQRDCGQCGRGDDQDVTVRVARAHSCCCRSRGRPERGYAGLVHRVPCYTGPAVALVQALH
jgi:hypothetical protein